MDAITALPSVDRASAMRRGLLTVNGVFLTVVGGAGVLAELLAYYARSGPLGEAFHASPYAIGWVENHGVACLIGVLMLAVGRRDLRRFWHGFALALHALLGLANVAFWASFQAFDVVAMGVVTTAAHALLVAAHAACLALPSAPVRAPTTRG